ncbi:carotenoid oxygenase family protein [Halomonas campaniensis]|uniref:carotenoid oxygenase family protein n=1 Tax=Halomonas campaniensis TaxID=213554 RepID=UPI000B534785|nr:carotenoid oxygenase family protein [Halomonas campaniensis]
MASGLAASTFATSILSFEAFAKSSGVGSPGSVPNFLDGHFRPVNKETTAFDLSVRGAIPSALSGHYFRNGHNPKDGINPGAWFYGSGMIHGLRISGGRAEWYRNRWVKTPALEGAPLFIDHETIDLHASAAGTSVIAHAGRILALQEVNLPFEITPELETIGAYDFGGALKTMMTAHPKICPRTGEMLFFGNSPLPPYLTYHVADASGRLVHSEVIEGPNGSVIHDFAITENYVIWFDPNVALDLHSNLAFPYTWQREYRGRIGVMSRDRSKGSVQWIDVDPYYMLHFSNAWEDADGHLVVEGPFFDEAAWGKASAFINGTAPEGAAPVSGAKRSRWTIDPQQGTARVGLLDDLTIEFPMIHLGFTGRQNRFAYAVVFPDAARAGYGIVKYDMEHERRWVLDLPAGVYAGEPCFVPDPQGHSEDDGWLLTYVTDLRSNVAELWILDATQIGAHPVAAIELPAWVPAGVHGTWIGDNEVLVSPFQATGTKKAPKGA